MTKLKLKYIFVTLLMISIVVNSYVSITASENSDGFDNRVDIDYESYNSEYLESKHPLIEISFDSSNISNVENKSEIFIDGFKATPIGDNNLWAEWDVEVQEDGLYNIALEYYPLPGRGKDIEFVLSINGKIPFDKASRLTLSRIWKDETEIKRDPNGNDLRPRQVESPRWHILPLEDIEGHYSEPYYFKLHKGVNKLRIDSTRENAAIKKIIIYNNELPEYNEIKKIYGEKGYVSAPEMIEVFQAEHTYEKSSSLLYPMYDRSGPATQPSHYSRIRLNTIGQLNWKYPGQWISWEIYVEDEGLYDIAFKSRQNYLQGLNCYRTLYVNGQIPFYEASEIVFPYDLNWYNKTLENEAGTMQIYLNSGKNIITLKATPGPTAEILKELNDAVLRLNTLYRKIIMVTGTSPDIYRSFYLEREIPGLIDDLSHARNILARISERIISLTGQSGTQASIVDQVIFMLDDIIKDPSTIPARIRRYKDNIESLGALILLLAEQPLELDYIIISSHKEIPSPQVGFMERFTFNLKSFFASFVEDYNSIGQQYGNEAITVWVSGGRDQAQVIKSMIDDLFTPQSGIPVNLNLVDIGATLVQATLAGKGPDISMLTPKDTPVNLAMRGALVDLSQLNGFEDIEKRFFPSAFIPYKYQGGVYAIPETQNFDMLFYRKDIFEELGIDVPQTWEELYSVIAVTQKNNLQVGILETNPQNVGISAGISTFEKMLLQSGGTYYTEDLSRTTFDTDIANNAFKRWVELYTEYGLERQFDFYNRFRSGEMPISIQPYPMYNMLTQAAPELRGLWDFAPIPGTKRPDGTIDRSESANGNGCIMLSSAKNYEDSFTYIQWWTSSEVQTRYGTELESIMGPAARYDTANIEAFRSLPWTEREAELLMTQWEFVTDIPQIPGNYFVARSLTNAFRSVIDLNYEPIRSLATYNRDINLEIARKRSEFGLE